MRQSGFSMVEALVCVLLLGVLALVAAAFHGPVQSAGAVQEDLVSMNAARSKLEELLAGPAVATAGQDTFDVGGMPLVRTWTSVACDLDTDALPETDAFYLRVQLGEVELETIRTDPAGVAALRR